MAGEVSEANDLSSLGSQSTRAAVSAMLYEANKLRRLSYAALAGVAALIILACFVVLFAGTITAIDLRSSQHPVSVIAKQLESVRSQISLTEFELADVKSLVEQGLTRRERLYQLQKELAELRGKEAPIEDQLNKSKDILSKLEEDFDKLISGPQNNDINSLVASAITRFGVVFVIMFFAHALVNLYRYCLRLSAFYNSRAVILAITDGDAEILERVSKVFSADEIILGKDHSLSFRQIKNISEALKNIRE